MRFQRLLLALVLAVSFSSFAVPLDAAKGSKGSGHSTKSSSPKTPRVKGATTHERSATKAPKPAKVKAEKPRRTPAVAVARDDKGRIKRSEAARHTFEVQSGYSHGRPGYVVDHIKPLACGGTDDPSNMQWQTIEAAKAKDRVERVGC